MSGSPSRDETCPWCTDRLTSDAVQVGPPPYAGTDTHRWTLHSDCIGEWRAFAEQVHRLSRIGAGRTLIEYPKNHGTDDLVERVRSNDADADSRRDGA